MRKYPGGIRAAVLLLLPVLSAPPLPAEETHHTNQDVYERPQWDDLIQASVVLATFVWRAAIRDERLPRKPMPKEGPRPTPTPVASAGKREVFDVARRLH